MLAAASAWSSLSAEYAAVADQLAELLGAVLAGAWQGPTVGGHVALGDERIGPADGVRTRPGCHPGGGRRGSAGGDAARRRRRARLPDPGYRYGFSESESASDAEPFPCGMPVRVQQTPPLSTTVKLSRALRPESRAGLPAARHARKSGVPTAADVDLVCASMKPLGRKQYSYRRLHRSWSAGLAPRRAPTVENPGPIAHLDRPTAAAAMPWRRDSRCASVSNTPASRRK